MLHSVKIDELSIVSMALASQETTECAGYRKDTKIDLTTQINVDSYRRKFQKKSK